jgi:hypothetical protein
MQRTLAPLPQQQMLQPAQPVYQPRALWEQYQDDKGLVYYFNTNTGICQY